MPPVEHVLDRGYGHLDTVSTLSRSLQSAWIPSSEYVMGIEKTGCHTGVDCWCNMIVLFQKMGDRSMGFRILPDCVTRNVLLFLPDNFAPVALSMSHLKLRVRTTYIGATLSRLVSGVCLCSRTRLAPNRNPLSVDSILLRSTNIIFLDLQVDLEITNGG